MMLFHDSNNKLLCDLLFMAKVSDIRHNMVLQYERFSIIRIVFFDVFSNHQHIPMSLKSLRSLHKDITGSVSLMEIHFTGTGFYGFGANKTILWNSNTGYRF